jgi:DNA-binding CsgD family transcriptional regulator
VTPVFASVSNAPSLDELRGIFRQEIAREGFTASACGAFLPTESGPEPHFFFTDWPELWLKIYQERNFVACDFGVAEARRRISPFTWLEAKSARILSAAERELWDATEAFGWSDGFSVPIHGPAGYFGLVTMGGPARVLPHETRRHLHMLALAVHDRARALTGLDPSAGPQAPLTARELECLRWVGAGHTDAQIAEMMHISATTVKTHVDGARLKLSARTRAHAVARMVVCGLA